MKRRVALAFLSAALSANLALAVPIDGNWTDNTTTSPNNMGKLVIAPHSFRFDRAGDDKKVVYMVGDPKPFRTAGGKEEFTQSQIYQVEGSNKSPVPLGVTYLIVDYFAPDKMLPDFENIRIWFYDGATPPDAGKIDQDTHVMMIEPFGRKRSQSN